MAILSRLTNSFAGSADRWLLSRVYNATGSPLIRLSVQDGAEAGAPQRKAVATLLLKDRATLLRLVRDPEMGFGDAYMNGQIEVEGDFLRFLEAVYDRVDHASRVGEWYSELASRWMEWNQDNSRRGSRKNIYSHYDLGNDFYKLWLDDQLLYTCAYFPTPSSTLEEAQIAKMDHVCRKLRLQPGETVVEAGCGWGALALHMAREYGVTVRAYNVSREQIAYARERAKAEGLSDRVEYIEDDYRAISGKFDAFVSVGMLEHVGASHFRELADAIHRAIGDTGRGLLHFIGRNYRHVFSRWIRKQIFPGAYAPSLAESIQLLEPKNFSVLDVENLRLHYAKTLEHWLERFEQSRERIAAMYDARFVRAWRLYLAGSIAGFRTGHLQLFQILFIGSKRDPLFWTREPLYAGQQQIVEPAGENTKWTHAMY